VARDGARFGRAVLSRAGWSTHQKTTWAEELVGNGYVVAALDHPYD
jgi:hypothetical protein